MVVVELVRAREEEENRGYFHQAKMSKPFAVAVAAVAVVVVAVVEAETKPRRQMIQFELDVSRCARVVDVDELRRPQLDVVLVLFVWWRR